MKVITFHNKKGGIGKTTLTGLVGAGLALRGRKVLLIDADQQGSLTVSLNVQNRAGFYKFVKWSNPDKPDFTPLRDTFERVPQDTCPKNLYIVPGSNETQGIPGSTTLKQIVEGFARRLNDLTSVFDYVVIDTQPSETPMHDAIGLITDWFICPIDPEPFAALHSLEQTIEHIAYVREQSLAMGWDKARVMGILPNRCRMQTVLHQSIVGALQTQYGDLVWEPLPLRTAIPEGQLNKKVLMHAAPHLKTNAFIWSLVDRVMATAEGKHA
ncbi:MAG: ParA family protein [Aggregatilineales bacterium]